MKCVINYNIYVYIPLVANIFAEYVLPFSIIYIIYLVYIKYNKIYVFIEYFYITINLYTNFFILKFIHITKLIYKKREKECTKTNI